MRHRCRRRLGVCFNETFYKPQGIPLRKLNQITITDEELETLRLRYIEKLDQRTAAEKMGISQSQYQRDIANVFKKITKALIQKEAIRIKKRN